MTTTEAQQAAASIMYAFAVRTGVSDERVHARRYLWTDAFAVVNFLELHRRMDDTLFLDTALRLVDQVHHELGRHRIDDPRTGWISGLDEDEGEAHPTRGGLRIGKELNESSLTERHDEHLEWERDGQYFHYLTKWMHSLTRVSQATGDGHHLLWATELAEVLRQHFVHRAPHGGLRMYWKMSIDLSRPVVRAMGHHDPLDGLVTFLEARAAAERASHSDYLRLTDGIADMRSMCNGVDWATSDPLGIGSLLFDAFRLLQLIADGYEEESALLEIVVEALLRSLESLDTDGLLEAPTSSRLAFRELGLSIGLDALPFYLDLWQDQTILGARSRADFEHFLGFQPLAERIKATWLAEENQANDSWRDHQDINSVMLATSLMPGGYLSVI